MRLTGYGKTITLHSILKFLDTPDTKLWTAEDPVKITQKGLRQAQINKKAGIDFTLIMRTFLLAEPEVMMVGERDDKETVSMGLEASLTATSSLAPCAPTPPPSPSPACGPNARTN